MDQSEAPFLDALIDYLRSGLKAGMNVPDAADTSLESFRVVVT